MKKLMMFLALAATISCTTVEPGHKGVEVSWGGETNMTKIYDEGLNTGLHWMWDDMVEYDCREQTVVNDFEFNDLNNMSTGCLLYTSPSPRDRTRSRMPSSA